MGSSRPVLQSYCQALRPANFGSRERILFRWRAEIFRLLTTGTIVSTPDWFFKRRRWESTV
jgi:hypothetical protein